MLRRGFSEVVYLSRFVLLFYIPRLLIYCYVLPNRHILTSLFHHHHPNHSVMKMKMVQRENSNALQIHKGKQPNVTSQIFLVWMVELLLVPLPMLLSWYVNQQGIILSNFSSLYPVAGI